MISESYIYKNELLKFATDLKKRRTQTRWTTRTDLIIERTIFFGFFIIRKLCETVKISDYLKTKNFKVSVLSIDAPFEINFTTDHKIFEYIDWENEKHENMPVIQICNQFIHSFLMTIVMGEKGGFAGIMVSSDRFKSKKCFFIRARTVIQIFQEFGKNYPSKSHWRREPVTCKLIEYVVE